MMTAIGGKKVSPIGIGTWSMGGGKLGFGGSGAEKEEMKCIKYAIENDINVIDTAEVYGMGRAETLVGNAIKEFGRDELFIITKVSPYHFARDKLINSAKNSLKRLNCQYIDLYLLHWPTPGMNMGEIMGAMETLADSGIINNIGVSNFSISDMEKAMTETKRHTIVANQIHYSLLERSPEDRILDFCDKNKIGVIAYTPIENGRVSEIREVVRVSEQRKKPPIQVALQYLMKRAIPIPKASRLEHMKEIVGTLSWEMNASDYKALKDSG